jgi:hypothetical protein
MEVMKIYRQTLTYTVSSSIVENTIRHCEANVSLACAYFFFDGRDSQKALQLHENLIRSLILQFSDQCDGMPAPLVELYRMCKNGHQQPPIDALCNTLQQILYAFEQAYIIIDSLDECTDRVQFLNWIEEIVSWKVGRLHLLATSRPVPDIENHLRSLDAKCLCLEMEPANDDIATYLTWMLQTDAKLSQWDEETRDNIRAIVMEKAQGMYACLQLLKASQLTPRPFGFIGFDGLHCSWTHYENA